MKNAARKGGKAAKIAPRKTCFAGSSIHSIDFRHK